MKNKKLNIYDLPLKANMEEFNFKTGKVRKGKLVVSKKLIELSAGVVANHLIDKSKNNSTS